MKTSFEDTLAAVLKLDPAQPAVEHDLAWWTWGELDQLSANIGNFFDKLDVPVGGRIGLLLRNRPAQLASLLGCILARRCAVAFNPLLPPQSLAADIASQDPAVLVGDAADLSADVLKAAAEQAIHVICLPSRAGEPCRLMSSADPETIKPKRIHPDTLIEMLTSGTTGTPKRIALLKESFVESLRAADRYEKRKSSEPQLRSGVRIVTAPLTHISGISAALMTLAGGRQIALFEKFSVEAWVSAVERHRAKVVNSPPAALRMILDANVPAERLKTLVALRSGTAPLDPAVIDAYMERYGLPVLQQYGATEFAGGVAGWSIEDFRAHYPQKRGSVGRIQDNMEARVVDETTGEPLAYGEVGLLELRGRQLGDRTKWVRTTDRASLDSDLFLWIHGRADNAINRGGFKIHPETVQNALEKHDSILEAVVVGLPDSRLGEVPAAAVILAPKSPPPTQEGLQAFLKDHLLPYQIPTIIRFLPDVPRTSMMKPDLKEVRRILKDESLVV